MKHMIGIALAALLAACAGGSTRDSLADETAIYERHAGAAEMDVRYTSIRNWWPVGHQSIVLEFAGARHYLVTLSGACDLELRLSPSLRIISSRHNVLGRFDRVAIGGELCRINTIRRLDMDAVKQDLEAARADGPESSEDVAVEVEDQGSGGT